MIVAPYWYLATPYTRYPEGLDAAWKLACREAGLLMQARVPVFSPIAHTHPIAVHAGMDLIDAELWEAIDRPMVDTAGGLIMLMANNWENSSGMKHELDIITAAGKPVVWMTPGIIPFEVLPIQMQDVVCEGVERGLQEWAAGLICTT